MNNKELETKIKELLAEENFFDLIEKTAEFEKEYKQSDFFKKTKISLFDVIKYSKVFYAFNYTEIFNKIQKGINNLNLDKINEVLEQLGATFETENNEVKENLDKLSNIMKN